MKRQSPNKKNTLKVFEKKSSVSKTELIKSKKYGIALELMTERFLRKKSRKSLLDQEYIQITIKGRRELKRLDARPISVKSNNK